MSIEKVCDEKSSYVRLDGIEGAPAVTSRRGAWFCKRLAMLVAAVLSAAQMLMAETETVGGYTWTYSVSGNTVELESVSPEPSGSLSIPSTLGGKPVTSIGSSVFAGCSALTEVTIPDGVTSIGNLAFEWSALTSVTIPASVTNIGAWAFGYCSSLTSMTMLGPVSHIGDSAFCGCDGLADDEGFIIVRNVMYGYRYDPEKTAITIPNSVTNIGAYALAGFWGTTSVTIPDSVTSIGDYAFYQCPDLTNVTFNGNAPIVGQEVFGVSESCVLHVSRGSTGWGVDIPGTWNGVQIEYISELQENSHWIRFVADDESYNELGGVSWHVDGGDTYNYTAFGELVEVPNHASISIDNVMIDGGLILWSGEWRLDQGNLANVTCDMTVTFVTAGRRGIGTLVSGITLNPTARRGNTGEVILSGAVNADEYSVMSPMMLRAEGGIGATIQVFGAHSATGEFVFVASVAEPVFTGAAEEYAVASWTATFDGKGYEYFQAELSSPHTSGALRADGVALLESSPCFTVTAVPYIPSARFAENSFEEQPVVTLSFGDEGFSIPDEYGSDFGYVFFVPKDANASNLVYCVWMDGGSLSDTCDWKYGYPVYGGETEVGPIEMLMLDGDANGIKMEYDIIVRTAPRIDEGELVTSWSSSGFSFYVTNVAPNVIAVKMGTETLRALGGVMGNVTLGATKQFSADTDDPSDIDYYADEPDYTNQVTAFETRWDFKLGTSTLFTTNVFGPPSVPFNYTFRYEGTYVIEVMMRDKDMDRGRDEWGPKFTFTVNVAPKPTVSLSPHFGSTAFTENDGGAGENALSRIDVNLSELPAEQIAVQLLIERVGTDNGNYPLPNLSTTVLTFGGESPNTTNAWFTLRNLDGTDRTQDLGFVIRAAVTNETRNGDNVQWKDVFRSAELPITIVNLAPEVTKPITNTVERAINEPFTINYTFRDYGYYDMYDRGRVGEHLYWTITGEAATNYVVMPNMNTYRGTFTTKFTSAGMKTVQLQVVDKDGGESEVATWYYNVERRHSVTVNGETTTYRYGDSVTFTAPGPQEANGVQIVTLGTTFTEPVVTNEFTMTVTNDIAFAWDILATNYWFGTSAASHGSIVAPESGWKPECERFTITAEATEHCHFVRWTGDVEGCVATNGTELLVVMDRSRIIGAEFEIDTHEVSFVLGAYGTRIGGGELVQTVTNGCSAVAPVLSVANGYDFDGWDASFDHVTGDMTVRASYVRIPLSVSVTGLNAVAQQGSSALDVTFDVLCEDQTQTNYVHLVARDEETGAEYPIRTVTGDSVYKNGNYHVTWNASADLPAGIVGKIRIHAFATAHPLVHRWGFNGNYLDTAGTMDATTTGNVTLSSGAATLAGGTRGTSYITLGHEVFPSTNQPRTIELWARQNTVRWWSRIFEFGTGTSDFIEMSWAAETDVNRDAFQIYDDSIVYGMLAPYSIAQFYHIVMSIEPMDGGTWRINCFKQDATTGETLKRYSYFTPFTNVSLSSSVIKTLYLGHSFFNAGDTDASATYDEVRIWNAVLRETELTRNVLAGKDIVTNSAAATSAALPVVTFDLFGHGTRTGGGELVQVVANGGNAEVPEVAADFGWLFAGWSESFSNVTASVNVVAQYESAFPFSATNAMDGVAYEGRFGNLTGQENITWSASGLLEGLTLSADGTLSGTVFATGTFTFSVTVTAPNGASRTMPVSLYVAENPNHRPVVAETSPASMPDLTLPGDSLTFNVVASDPDGDALSYMRLIDGVTNSVNTTGVFNWMPEELDGGTRTVTCLVSDGFWAIPANDGWRISMPKWYVSGEGTSTNAGTTASTPFREIQEAVDAAAEGDVIFVAEGVYGPINTANKKIRVIATGGLDKTIIDGGGTNRCVFVGGRNSTNTVIEGFTICNGWRPSGSWGVGAQGGTLRRCIIRDCTFDGANSVCGGGAAEAVLENCLIVGNAAYYGGGTRDCTLINCTVVGNTATSGGGVYGGKVINSIVWDNYSSGNVSSNYYAGVFSYSCTAPTRAPSMSESHNVVLEPYFTDPANGDYRLRQYSPCLDVGNNANVVGDSDLSGTNRVIDGRVDMGCYEGWVYLPKPSAIGDVSAEDGTRIGIVRLTWTADGDARTYDIYRASTNILAASELIGTTSALFFDDDTAEPTTNYWYWVKGVNPAGEGPFGASDSGWCMAPMAFGTDELATAMVGLPYNAQLAISGGSGNYVWTSGADDYDIDGWESTYLMDIDSPRGLLFGDDVSTSYPLPFDFPFYGKSYNKLWISSNGTLTFDGEFRTYTPSLDVFKSRVMVTPFWKDLLQGSGGVYVSENGGESVTFLWYNGMYYSGHGLVNASVTLFADGSIVCSYGDGNANGAFVGISAGDGTRFRYFDKQGTSLNNADDIVFLPQDVPGGLTLGEDGTLSGTPTAPGEYVFTVFVTDEYGNGVTHQVSVTVEENPNMRTVTFDLGEYGVRSGGGDLHQYVLLGESATAPSVRSRAGWVFDGWNGSFTNIADSVTVAAKYRSAYADLHVDGVEVRRVGDNAPYQSDAQLAATAGDRLVVSWTVGNTGNPPFNGKMTEYVRFIDAADSSNVKVAATLEFNGSVARDGDV